LYQGYEYTDDSWLRYNGNIFLKSLDGSSIIRTDLLLREAVQNSYDAKKEKEKPVQFFLNGKHLSDSQANYLAGFLQCVDGQASLDLSSRIKENLFCLEVADKGTVGLQGPCQQYDSEGNELLSDSYNYRDSVLMMGGGKDGDLGGIFGIGKASFFLVSSLYAVVIYSRTVYRGKPETRLIIRFFQDDSSGEMKKYWVGDNNENKCQKERSPYPFINEKADSFAQNIGMMKYEEDEFGTSVMILGCSLEDENEDENNNSSEYVLSEYIPRRIPHWFWPKMITEDKSKKIDFYITLDGVPIPLLHPMEAFSPYFYYNFTYNNWLEKENNEEGRIECKNPKAILGYVTTKKIPAPLVNTNIRELIGEGNNVCLAYMRNVELIVKYEQYYLPGLGDDVLLAMFHTNPVGHATDEPVGTVELAFRNSENQTHDKWSENQVQGRQRTYVRIGLRRIKEYLKTTYDYGELPKSEAEISIAFASELGRFLASTKGSSSSNLGGSSGSSSKQKVKATFEIFGTPQFLDDRQFSRRVVYRLKTKKWPTPLKPSISVILADGSRSKELNYVVLEEISFSIDTNGVNRETIPLENGMLRIDRDGSYFFTFVIEGNIKFECKLIEVQNEEE